MKNIFCIVLLILIGSCKSTTNTVKSNRLQEKAKPNTITDLQPNISLADYLRRVSGVTVKGGGSNATVSIRSGATSINLISEPLFLINGTAFNGSFSELTSVINVNDVKSIRVYKDVSDLAMYGVRGANGVIDFRLK